MLMKKILYIASIFLLGAVGCTKEMAVLEKPKAEKSGLVEVMMKLRVHDVELAATTKANDANMAENPHIKSIRVAVFGKSGYPQTYAYAEPVKKVVEGDETKWTAGEYASTNYDPKTRSGIYYFKVLLPVYEGACTVHVIANGDESIPFVDQTENSIMSAMKTQKGEGAYWARVNMPDGILTIKDENGIMQTNDDGNFIPSEETARLFTDLTLVRNFAEVVIINNAKEIKNISWTLVNVPVSGSVAPMEGGEKTITYVDDYKDFRYVPTSGLMVHPTDGRKYLGYMIDETIEKTKATVKESDLTLTVPNAVVVIGEDDTETVTPGLGTPGFMYERVKNEDTPTAILLKATYKDDSAPTYYRVDLMDEKAGGYFPIYRNYKYQIKINRVGNRGADTIEEAMERNVGGNVSYSAEAKSLTDISDGSSRLFVDYVSKTFTNADERTQTFAVYYVPDVNVKDPNGPYGLKVDNSSVKAALKEGVANEAIDGDLTFDSANSSQTGKYYYTFKLKNQSKEKDLTSIFQVSASNNAVDDQGNPDEDNLSTLYRDVKITVVKDMEMKVFLKPNHLSTGEKYTVLHIAFTDPLPESMFPLLFYIEDANHTLNPTGYDGNGDPNNPNDHGNKIIVPVQTGTSYADGKSNSFYFIRTVNYSEYEPMYEAWLAAQEEEEGSDPGASSEDEYPFDFTTEFQTIKEASATKVFVDNEYFSLQSCNLLNDGLFVYPQKQEVKGNVTSVTISVDAYDQNQKWTASATSPVSVTPSTEQTGKGSFTMSFPPNDSYTEDVTWTATVTTGTGSSAVRHTVTIIQKAHEFSLTPDSQLVAYTATSAVVKVNAEEGLKWEATVDNGATLSYEGEAVGPKTLTVKFDPNSTGNSRKTYTVSVSAKDDDGTVVAVAEASIIQKRVPYEVERTIAVGIANFNDSGVYTATTYGSELQITMGNVAGVQGDFILLNRQSGSITVKANALSSIQISYYNNYYVATELTATAGTVNSVTSWTDDSGSINEVTLYPWRGDNYYCVINQLKITYLAD